MTIVVKSERGERMILAERGALVVPSFLERKRALLCHLTSPTGKAKYKRYVGAPIRYAGGKSLAVGFIVELMPDNVERVISPFLGGGSFEVACARELDVPVIASDIFPTLATYWKVHLANPKGLFDRLRQFAPSVEEFYAVKERLKKHWTGELPLSNDLEIAAYFYFNHNTSYGPHFLGWPSRIYLNPKRYQSIIEKVRDFRAENLSVECDTFENVIPKYNDDFYTAPH